MSPCFSHVALQNADVCLFEWHGLISWKISKDHNRIRSTPHAFSSRELGFQLLREADQWDNLLNWTIHVAHVCHYIIGRDIFSPKTAQNCPDFVSRNKIICKFKRKRERPEESDRACVDHGDMLVAVAFRFLCLLSMQAKNLFRDCFLEWYTGKQLGLHALNVYRTCFCCSLHIIPIWTCRAWKVVCWFPLLCSYLHLICNLYPIVVQRYEKTIWALVNAQKMPEYWPITLTMDPTT